MQHVSIHTYRRFCSHALWQHAFTLSYLAFPNALSFFFRILTKETSSAPHVCDKIAYGGVASLAKFSSSKFTVFRSHMVYQEDRSRKSGVTGGGLSSYVVVIFGSYVVE